MTRAKTTDKTAEKLKATNAESAKRTNIIYNMLLIGASRADILQYSAEQWQISERNTDEYIAKATALLETKIAQSQELELNRALQRREMLFQKNMKIQDYKAALAVEKDKSELLQLYPAKQVNIGIKIDIIVEFLRTMQEIGESPEQVLTKMIERARAKQNHE